jgi:tetratricopeptide (TPR) repeat protein
VVLRVAAMALGAFFVSACNSSTEPVSLERAETLCLDRQYEEAIPVLKSLLVREPENAGAHFYLGVAYLGAKRFLPELSLGEFQTALRLFQKQGEVSPIERFSSEYFEMMCYVNQGKVVFRDGLDKIALGARRRHIEPHLAELERLAEAARGVIPEAEEADVLNGYAASLIASTRRGKIGGNQERTVDP